MNQARGPEFKASCSQRPLAAVQVSILAGIGMQAKLHLSHPQPGGRAAVYSCKGRALLNSRERPPSKGYDVVIRWPAWVRLNVPKTEDSIFTSGLPFVNLNMCRLFGQSLGPLVGMQWQ